MSLFSRLAVLSLALLLVAGCASSDGHFSLFGGKKKSKALPVEVEAIEDLGYNLTWLANLDLPKGQKIKDTVVLGDLLVVTEKPEAMVSALRISDGSLAWRRVVGSPNETIFAPARRDDHILVNTEGQLYKIDANTGEIAGLQNLDHAASVGPLVIDNLAFFGSVSGIVFAHNLNTGYSKWTYALTSKITTPPTTSGDFDILAADSKGVYVLLTAKDGQPIFRKSAFDGIVGQPAIDRLAVYVPSTDQSLYVRSRSTGQERWVYRATRPITVGPTVMGLTLLQPLEGQGLLALDAVHGTRKWLLDGDLEPITEYDDAYLLKGPGELRIVNAATGETMTSVFTRALEAALVDEAGNLLVITPRGRVARLSPQQ